MKSLKKNLPILYFVLCVILTFIPLGVFADTYSYSQPIYIYNNSTNTYGATPILVYLDNSELVTLGFINATGLNTNLADGSVDREYLSTTSRIATWVTGLNNHQLATYDYRLNNDPGRAYFQVIPGIGGNYTVADSATLNLGQVFEVDGTWYIDDELSFTNTTIVYQQNAYREYIYGTNLTTYIDEQCVFGGMPGTPVNNADVTKTQFYAYNFTAQDPNYLISGIEVFSSVIVASATDYLRCSIRAEGSNSQPTGPDLAWGERSMSSFLGGANWNSINMTVPFQPTLGSKYFVVFGVVGPGAGQFRTLYSNLGIWPGHGLWGSTDAGKTWNTSVLGVGQFRFTTAPFVDTDVSSLSVGEHNIVVSGNATAMGLYVDGEFKDNYNWFGTNGTPDAPTPWYIMTNNRLVYQDSLEITVGGVQRLLHQPIAMITGSSIPDRSGNSNTGTINWGSNPTDIEVSFGALINYSSYLPPGAGAGDIPQTYEVPGAGDIGSLYGNTETGATLPAHALVEQAAIAHGVSTKVEYGYWMVITSLALTFLMLMLFGPMVGVFTFVIMLGVSVGSVFGWVFLPVILGILLLMWLWLRRN